MTVSRFRWTAAALGFVLMFAAPSVPAQANQMAYPGDLPPRNIVRLQKKAEAAFVAGQYQKARWFYEKELAPIGDKYGQYMMGYLYENGLGVEQDAVKAAAWYQLAAERGHKQIIETSERFQKTLSPGKLATARTLANGLKDEYGDIALLKREIRRDLDRLRDVTGTNLRKKGCEIRPGTVYFTRGIVRQLPMNRYCEILNKRIDERIAYIQGYVTYGQLELLPDEDEAAEEADAEE